MSKRKKTRRRANGEGSVYRRESDGLYVAAVSKHGRRLVGYAKTQADADLLLAQLKVQAAVAPNTIGPATVDTCVKGYLSRLQVDGTTRDWMQDAYDGHGKPAIGHMPLHLVKPTTIADWVSAMASKSPNSKVRQAAFDTVRGAMREAVTLGLIVTDPTFGLRRPRYQRSEMDIYTPDEVRTILDAAKGSRNEAVYWLAFGCGMRQGEIYGLQWTDLDLENGWATIRRQVVEVKGKQIIRPKPKTKAGLRTVQLSAEVIAVLHERRSIAMSEGLAACEWVCPTERGLPWRRSNFAHRHWKPLLDDLGLKVKGLHHGRHSAATLMLRARVPTHIVSAVIGHSKTSTTVDIYGHALPGDDSGALSTVANQISAATSLLQDKAAGSSGSEGKQKSG